MSHRRGARPRATLLAVGAVALVASGCACMYGACGGNRERGLEYGGQRCSALEGTSRNWYQLGSEGAKVHQFGGEDFYVYCFAYKGKKGATLSVVVESSAFEPEVYLQREGRDGWLAADKGERTARISMTLPDNGMYGVVVTSRRPRDTGRFDVRYSASAR